MRQVKTVMPEGHGVWVLAYEDTGEIVPDRGPFIAHKSALKAARLFNGQPEIKFTVTLAPEPAPEPPKVSKPNPTPKEIKVTLPPASTATAGVPTMVSSADRHAWIEDAAQFALEIVAKAGGEVHERIRVTLGWPIRAGRKALGECWSETASADLVREIFISPTLSDGARIVDVLIHELCHACLPHEAKHGPKFKALATACGLTGKMTATVASDELTALITAWIEKRGLYPAGALDPLQSGRKKQTTRLVKAHCAGCGYTVRVTAKWLVIAVPECPNQDCDRCGDAMDVGDDE